ncbi:MAG: FtsX-like permease family protein [candidate division Zixibacteria bacterium]|nr:FtsX-like permease family protein [candidate division Zixibacteria bacterium]
MWLQLKLAWRNIFRNKRRTTIAAIAIGIGLAAMIFTDALIIGMKQNMIASATSSFLGQAQIHRDGFRDNQEVERVIVHPDSVLQQLQHDSLVAHATPRVMALAMLASPSDVSAISVVGVDPTTEQHLSQIDEALTEGDYFADSTERALLIGNELADLLQVGLNDRVVLTVSEASTGALSQEMFRVSGIFHFNVEEIDKGMAFVRIEKARDFLNLPGAAHEIALTFTNPDVARNSNHPFFKRYSEGENEAVGWPILMPQLDAALEMSQFSTYLVGIVLFSVVALGIINTLFMSLHERMFEFGVMRAVGTGSLAIARLILFEAGALAFVSILLGMVLGLVVTLITAATGIDYSGIEFAGVTFRELLYPVMTLNQFTRFPVWVFIFTIVVGLYPAIYAARMRPADALRRSL